MVRLLLTVALTFAFAAIGTAQTAINPVSKKTASNQASPAVKYSPAYAELLLRKTEREAQLEEFLLDYTDEFPKVKEIKFELNLLQKQLDKISAVNASDALKLSLALGKLLVRKTELEVDLMNLRNQYDDKHPEVKRAIRKIEVYAQAIKEILP